MVARLFYGHRKGGDLAAGGEPAHPARVGQPDVSVGAEREPVGSLVLEDDADLPLSVDPHDLREVVSFLAREIRFRVVAGEPGLSVGADDQRSAAAGGRDVRLRKGRHLGTGGDRRGAGGSGEREQDDRADR